MTLGYLHMLLQNIYFSILFYKLSLPEHHNIMNSNIIETAHRRESNPQ